MIVAEGEVGVDDGELGAVLCALAGPRRGDAVGAVGAPSVAVRALLAASGTSAQVAAGARIVVTGPGDGDAEAGAALLAPGGRLVGLADDAAQAAGRAGALGLVLRHVEPCGTGVAWSAVSAARP